jgi:hypothetical protein
VDGAAGEEGVVNPCTVTTGFFLLRGCGRPAVAGCARCGRGMCQGHAAQNGGICPECSAPATEDFYHPYWTDGYRRRYYTESASAYNDPYWYSTFDTYDRGAFDQGGDWASGGGDFDGDFDGSDFVDS